MRRLFSVIVMVAVICIMLCTSALAGTVGGSSGGGARPSSPPPAPRPSSPSPSSGARPVSGSPASSARPVSGAGGVRPSSPIRPSSGPKANPPTARLVPHTLPPNARVPRGANFARDTARIGRSSRYTDPYDSLYYGNPASPYFYLYLMALQDNDPANPIPYQEARCKPKKKGVSGGVVVILVIGVGLVCGGVGYFVGKSVNA